MPEPAIGSDIFRFCPWLAASVVIHGLIVLCLWDVVQVPQAAAGRMMVEVEMLAVNVHADASLETESVQPDKSLREPSKTGTAINQAPKIARAEIPLPVSASEVVNHPGLNNGMGVAEHLSADSVQSGDVRGEAGERVRQHLEAHKFYPASARRRGIAGEVEVGFMLDQLGMAAEIMVLASSGYDLLDWAAKETVKRAQPFPAAERSFHFRLRFRKL
ncbi:MAG: energy transducer TonB [Mariprofundaceae bacterium]